MFTKHSTLHIGDRGILVEVADTWYSRIRGLFGRVSLDADRGMLFVFPYASSRLFWMFGMKFPLDFVFLRDGVIVKVVSNVPCPKGFRFPAIISSYVTADAVLEMNAGKAKEWGLREGMMSRKAVKWAASCFSS